ncbi:MAG: hypothetical protein JWL72_3578 [Ilumatobacteraceae bacterium]|nr:hypothetical protein [Ilumatobacteraceae bacterium]
MSDVLTMRAVNRATLARQHLLERASMSAVDAIAHLVGLQAQAPFAPYYGLWCRLDGFSSSDLSAALVERQVVRVVLMRGTVHLVVSADCLGLRAVVQPIMDRDLRTNSQHARELVGVDLAALALAAAEVLSIAGQTPKEQVARLPERFPGVAPAKLAHAARELLPLVQIPPRAIWGSGGAARSMTAQAWLGDVVSPVITIDRLVERYLGAFGPASVNDMQTWSGLTRLREVFERVPGLLRFAGEDGGELFDVAEAPRPDPDTAAPVRLLADFDNLVLSHADRRRVMTDDTRRRLFDVKNGIIPGALMVDGWVAGTWSITGARPGSVVDIRPYDHISRSGQADAVAEGERLLGLTGFPGPHDVRVHHPSA